MMKSGWGEGVLTLSIAALSVPLNVGIGRTVEADVAVADLNERKVVLRRLRIGR